MRRAISLVFVAVVLLTSLSLKQDSFYFEARKHMMDVCWMGNVKYNAKLGDVDVEKVGEFVFNFPKYRLSFPGSDEMICNGNELLYIDHKSEEVYLTNANRDNLGQDILPDSVAVTEEAPVGDLRHFSMSIGENGRLEVWINKKTRFMDKAKILMPDGNRMTYDLSNIRFSISCADDRFSINPKSWGANEYIITDMRE